MTKDEVVALGVASQKAQQYFQALCWENTRVDPKERVEQIERYERARADMYEAMNRHHAALGLLGTDSDAKVIAEKDTEIRSMIAVHNSDIDGMRLQEENIAGQKKVIAELREALKMVYSAYDTPAWLEELPRAMVKLKVIIDANEQTAGK